MSYLFPIKQYSVTGSKSPTKPFVLYEHTSQFEKFCDVILGYVYSQASLCIFWAKLISTLCNVDQTFSIKGTLSVLAQI